MNRVISHPRRMSQCNDVVTAADREVERFLTDGLSRLFPQDGVFGEEGAAVAGGSGRTWVIDPIDGILNFVRGREQRAVSVGLFRDGCPQFGIIHAPARDQLLIGGRNLRPTLNGQVIDAPAALERSSAVVAVSLNPAFPVSERLAVMEFIMADASMAFRNYGSAATSLLELAAGQVDGYVGLGLSTWDVMGGAAITGGLGMEYTVDWARLELSSKLKFVGGPKLFLDAFSPLVERLHRGNIRQQVTFAAHWRSWIDRYRDSGRRLIKPGRVAFASRSEKIAQSACSNGIGPRFEPGLGSSLEEQVKLVALPRNQLHLLKWISRRCSGECQDSGEVTVKVLSLRRSRTTFAGSR